MNQIFQNSILSGKCTLTFYFWPEKANERGLEGGLQELFYSWLHLSISEALAGHACTFLAFSVLKSKRKKLDYIRSVSDYLLKSIL